MTSESLQKPDNQAGFSYYLCFVLLLFAMFINLLFIVGVQSSPDLELLYFFTPYLTLFPDLVYQYLPDVIEGYVKYAITALVSSLVLMRLYLLFWKREKPVVNSVIAELSGWVTVISLVVAIALFALIVSPLSRGGIPEMLVFYSLVPALFLSQWVVVISELSNCKKYRSLSR